MSRRVMMAALGSLPPRLNPARDRRESEDARLWKRVRTLETNLGYSNLTLDNLRFRPEHGATHIVSYTDDYGSHHGHGQHRKGRVPGPGLPAKLSQGPAQNRVFEENKKGVPSLPPLSYGEKLTPFTQPQQPFAQRTVALHGNRPLDRLPVPSNEGNGRENIQAGPAGSMTASVMVARGSSDSFCGDGGFLPSCPDASQRSPSGATAIDTGPEVDQSSHRSVQNKKVASFVSGVSSSSPISVTSATTTNTTSSTTFARVEAATELAKADDREERNFDFNEAGVSTRRTEFFTAAAADSTTSCYSCDNLSVGQQQYFHHDVERRAVNNEVEVGVAEKSRGNSKLQKLRVRVPVVAPPGQKLRSIRTGYCRSLVSPNNPLTSNTVVARVKKGLQSGCEKRPKVLLVGSGTFNPVHKLHIRRFYLARNFLETRKGVSQSEACGFVLSYQRIIIQMV